MNTTFQFALLATGLLLKVSAACGQSSTSSPATESRPAVLSQGGERAAAATTTNAHSFSLFLPREDVFSHTPEVEDRIRAYLKSNPGDIPLAKDPLISDKDIEAYDWKTHTLTVDPSVAQRLRPPSVWGTPFVVVADGEPVYVGAFYTLASSQSCPVPVILTVGNLRGANKLVIDRSYASPRPDPSATDPRMDLRVKNSLQALGKLKE